MGCLLLTAFFYGRPKTIAIKISQMLQHSSPPLRGWLKIFSRFGAAAEKSHLEEWFSCWKNGGFHAPFSIDGTSLGFLQHPIQLHRCLVPKRSH
jgi:hypothetical protein